MRSVTGCSRRGSRRDIAASIVAVGDRLVEAGGLWPADVDLLSRLEGIERIEVVATEAQLAAGFHVRIHDLLPGIEEVRVPEEAGALDDRTLVVPADSTSLHFTSRDREEELADVVRRIKARRRESPLDAPRLDRTAVVFGRPLPYVYLAREVFGAARVPFQTDDALPLAAESGAAALDLVLAFVSSGAGRVGDGGAAALTALRSGAGRARSVRLTPCRRWSARLPTWDMAATPRGCGRSPTSGSRQPAARDPTGRCAAAPRRARRAGRRQDGGGARAAVRRRTRERAPRDACGSSC